MRDEDRGRRFTVADGMIVVAGLAILVAWFRADIRGREWFLLHPVSSELPGDKVNRVYEWFTFAMPRILSATTLTWLILRLRPPRPSLRRLNRRPGWRACSTAGALVVLTLVVTAVQAILNRVRNPSATPDYYWHDSLTLPIATAVLGAWLPHLWGLPWRAEAHWLGRLGRLIGAGWIMILVVTLILNLLLGSTYGWIFAN